MTAIERAIADFFGGVPDFLIITAAVATAVGVIWRKVVIPVRGFVRRFKAWMTKTEEALDWVYYQMRPNDGGSLDDRLRDLSGKVDMLLEHDAERDAIGLRYGDKHNQEEAS